MFASDSRYVSQPTYTGHAAGRYPGHAPWSRRCRRPAPLAGYHQPPGRDRLDLLAVQYLNAPTGFWRLCDANNAMVAGALAARALIGIPAGGPE